jgi:hypothetical protein
MRRKSRSPRLFLSSLAWVASLSSLVLPACGQEDSSASNAGPSAPDAAVPDSAGGDAAMQESGPEAGSDGGEDGSVWPEGGDDAGEGGPDGSAPYCLSCTRWKVGPPIRLFGPVGSPGDSQMFAMPGAAGLVAWSANATTQLLQGPSLETLQLIPGAPVLEPGPAGGFDECGAWLQAAEPDQGILRGWYHAEEECDYAVNQTHKSVAYAESTNGGLTFSKTAYPDNRVLTGTSTPAVGTSSGAGDHSVVRWHGDLWMYFIDWSTPWGTGVARAPGASGGVPGSWQKWYQGAFSEPGLGGQTTVLGWLGTSVSHHAPSDQLVLAMIDPAFGGVRLAFSKDGIVFEALAEPLVVVEEESWVRTPDSGELFAYLVVVPPQGGKGWNDEFYLSYVYLPPGEAFDQRHQVVRRVTVETQAAPVSPQVRVALARTFSAVRNDHWITTSMVPSDYGTESVLGYMATTDAGGMTKLLDCYIPGWDDHMVGPGDCGGGAVVLRTLGWAYPTQQPGTVALRRCYLASQTDHWVSTNPCEQEAAGAVEEFVLGYVPED